MAKHSARRGSRAKRDHRKQPAQATHNLPVQKNETIEATIEDLTHEGQGVAKVDGYALFVPNAIPGEKATIKVIKTKKNHGFGRLVELQEESPDRVEPPCPIYKWCGGCQLQHISYDAQLKAKQKQVKDAMAKIAHQPDLPVYETIGMTTPWRYRNKAQVPVGTNEDGHLKAGFYQKRSHDIIDMESCIIQANENDDAVQITKRILDEEGIEAYDEEQGRGVIRHITARHAASSGDVMVILITNTKELPNQDEIIEKMRDRIPTLKSIVHNINPENTNVIFGETTNTLWGDDYIYDTIGTTKFALSARSFYQVNPEQTKVLYEQALNYAQLKGGETVIDAYCGIGTISLFLAEKAAHVYGVDSVGPAIADATQNARLNNIDNATFKVGNAEDVIPWWYEAMGIKPDVIVVDPPRKGCDEKLLKTMLDMKPERIVYVSCNPATLARDINILAEGGYEAQEVQPVDMFPQTTHVECVSQIVLKEEGGSQ
ncbi:23S rRNA (uracil(1939)-C(5))-methyltransferase RlmD [Salsuginibacillus kocurii]|uniref:23S rRNA (uracil(1939)-C(5))-methyltransferase RlmD n=1 Tax=Salsuginibacillus kocurii TaxID=427078 RepID=UPI000371EB64|nr:23S rRNA (uracil(1939)-C(5))-methyltransferase RlmD [Salsuginibacillus kocurii]